jgi:hypothetical protein
MVGAATITFRSPQITSQPLGSNLKTLPSNSKIGGFGKPPLPSRTNYLWVYTSPPHFVFWRTVSR